jgi:hypothetical protein
MAPVSAHVAVGAPLHDAFALLADITLEGKGTVGFRGRVAFACEADGRSATLVRYEISTNAIGPAIGPLRTINESGARLLGLDLDYSLRRLDALVAGRDVDGVAAPTSDEIAAESDGGLGPLLKLAGRLR